MRTAFAAATLLLVPACVHSTKHLGPHGETMVSVRCNGALLSMGDCMDRARQECGGNFEVAGANQQTNYVANFNRNGGYVTPVQAREMEVVCDGSGSSSIAERPGIAPPGGCAVDSDCRSSEFCSLSHCVTR